MSRDAALIFLTGVIVAVSIAGAVMLALNGDVDPSAALGVITGSLGIAGMALGRLSGAPAAITPAQMLEFQAASKPALVGNDQPAPPVENLGDPF